MKRPRDLYWRRASMQVAGGPDGDVYLPMIYPPINVQPGASAADALTDALRLGRATDWSQAGQGGPTRGLGAVTLLVGDETLTWAEMDKVSFQVAA
jgi:type VI secretion system protein ImpE